jgi:hypothetical protein
MARSRRACPEPAEGTPAMLVGRCSSELSSHKLQAKSKKSQAPSELGRASEKRNDKAPYTIDQCFGWPIQALFLA